MPQTHPSDHVFAEFPNVSKKELTVNDALAVRKAVQGVIARIPEVGRSLAISSPRLEAIKKVHAGKMDRQSIAIIDTWLRQDINKSKAPYNIKGNEPHPNWWSLVWAVAHRVGGNNPAEARKIAENYESYHQVAPEKEYMNVDKTPFEQGEEDEIAVELQGVWPLWYEIGTGLKLPTSTLDLLTGDPQNLFIEMIKRWIIEGRALGPSPPCWSTLVEVVGAPYGGQNSALADMLASDHPDEAVSSASPKRVDSQPMETEFPTSTSDFQAVPKPGLVGVDSARLDIPSQSSDPVTSPPSIDDSQPEILPYSGISDDGGKVTLNHFIVYNRNKYSGGDRKPHGLALVIANEKFKGLPQRLCANVDERRLLKSLGNLGYRVVIRRNQTAENMDTLFRNIGRGGGNDGDLQIKREDDSFICIITSHGDWDAALNTDVIYGSDDATIDLQETAYKYLGTTACNLLKGKPKLFFVQACRGGQYGRIAADDSGPSRLPHESDFFISYSTAPMTKAFRFDPNKTQPEGGRIDLSTEQSYDRYNIGSFYITEICMAFDNFSKKMDLMAMILFVHQRLQADDNMLFKLGPRTTRQCPHMSVSLRGPVFFHDKAEDIFREHVKQCLK